MGDKLLKRHPQIKAKILPDGYVILYSKEIDWVYTLTPLAGIIWEFCDGVQTLENIVDFICTIKEVPQDQNLKEKITRFIEDLERVNLLIDKKLANIPTLIGSE